MKLADVEFVISDNNSKDNTEILVRSINDDRIKYFKNIENLGYDKNILKLVEKANGDYILLLSDEDFINSNQVEKLVFYLRKKQIYTVILGSIGIIQSNKRQFYLVNNEKVISNREFQNTSTHKYFKYYPNESFIGEARFFNILSDFSLFHGGYLSGIVVKRAVLDTSKLDVYDKNLYTHYLLIIQSLLSGPGLVISNILCYIGPQFETNILNIYTGPVLESQLTKRIQAIQDLVGTNQISNSLISHQRDMLAFYFAGLLHYPPGWRHSIREFMRILPYLININELNIKKMDFWVKVFVFIPIKWIRRLLKSQISNSIPFRVKHKILKMLYADTF